MDIRTNIILIYPYTILLFIKEKWSIVEHMYRTSNIGLGIHIVFYSILRSFYESNVKNKGT